MQCTLVRLYRMDQILWWRFIFCFFNVLNAGLLESTNSMSSRIRGCGCHHCQTFSLFLFMLYIISSKGYIRMCHAHSVYCTFPYSFAILDNNHTSSKSLNAWLECTWCSGFSATASHRLWPLLWRLSESREQAEDIDYTKLMLTWDGYKYGRRHGET